MILSFAPYRYFLCLIAILISAIEVSCQPYWYFTAADSGSWYPTSVMRINLSNGNEEEFLGGLGTINEVATNADQSLLFTQYRYGGRLTVRRTAEKNIEYPLTENVGRIGQVLCDKQNTILCLSYYPDSVDDQSAVEMYEQPTMKKIGSISQFGPWYEHLSLDSNGVQLYGFARDTNRMADRLLSVDRASNVILLERYIRDIFPYPAVIDIKNIVGDGQVLIKREDVQTSDQPRYVLYDFVKDRSFPQFQFPWRCETYLSPDADNVIMERVDYPGPVERQEYHRGEFYVFDSHSGKLKHRVFLPPDGMTRMIENSPGTFYYFFPTMQHSYAINLNQSSPIYEMIDTLEAMRQQSLGAGGISDPNLADGLQSRLSAARQWLADSDSVNCSRLIHSFNNIVDSAYFDASGGGRSISSEAWKQLSFNSRYIIDRLPPSISRYPLNVSVKGAGRVHKQPEYDSYDSASTVWLTASPAEGFSFSGWTGDISDTTNPLPVSIRHPVSLTATFNPSVYSITATAGEHGSITPEGIVSAGYGDTWIFTIQADKYYHIAELSIDGIPADTMTRYIFSNITGNHSIHAEFGVDQYPLTIVTVGQGYVGRIPLLPIYPAGTTVRLEASSRAAESPKDQKVLSMPGQTPVTWVFDHWEGDLKGKQNPVEIIMDKNKSIQAIFRSIRTVWNENK